MEVSGWPSPVNLAVTRVPPAPSVAGQGLGSGADLAGAELALPPREADEAATAQQSGGEHWGTCSHWWPQSEGQAQGSQCRARPHPVDRVRGRDRTGLWLEGTVLPRGRGDGLGRAAGRRGRVGGDRAAPLGAPDGTHWAVALGARGAGAGRIGGAEMSTCKPAGGVGLLQAPRPQAPRAWRRCPHRHTAALLFLPGNKIHQWASIRSFGAACGGRGVREPGRGGKGRPQGSDSWGPDSQSDLTVT